MRRRRWSRGAAPAAGRRDRAGVRSRSLHRAGGLRASWLAVLALLVQLAGLSHALLVRHARCAHGELVHVAAGAPLTAAAPAQAERARRGEPIAEQDARHDLDDDHCDAFALRGRLGAQLHCVAEATLLEVVDLAPLRPAAEVRPIPLLILAPKSSPPAA